MSDTSNFQDIHWLLDIIQSTDVGMVVLDKNFEVQIYNRFMQVHSNIGPEQAIGSSVFDLFSYLDNEWFKRRVNTVFELGISVYTTWEQRNSVFDFSLKLPIHHETQRMFQNTTFIPLRNSRDEIEKVGIVVYDVTDTAINRAKLEMAKDELLCLSRIDKLTALWNRGYWEERLNDEFKRNQRSDSSVTLVMLDIDHFKNINDTYGHQIGDEAIRGVSRLLTENSRAIDICGRYGGEEFAAVLPDTDVDGAIIFCERLRRAIEGYVLYGEGKEIKLTVSLGIALLDKRIKYPADWIVSADKALYKSKEGGRNQTHVFGAGRVSID